MENAIKSYEARPNGTKLNAFRAILFAMATVAAGSLVGFLGGAKNGYEGLVRPTFTPPDFVFPIAWSVLYAAMGVSLYLTFRANDDGYKTAAIALFFVQIALNFAWVPTFFLLKAFFAAFLILAALDSLTLALIVVDFKVSKVAAALDIPYLAWLIFATVLNVAILVFN